MGGYIAASKACCDTLALDIAHLEMTDAGERAGDYGSVPTLKTSSRPSCR